MAPGHPYPNPFSRPGGNDANSEATDPANGSPAARSRRGTRPAPRRVRWRRRRQFRLVGHHHEHRGQIRQHHDDGIRQHRPGRHRRRRDHRPRKTSSSTDPARPSISSKKDTTPNVSTCSGQCAATWPALTVSGDVVARRRTHTVDVRDVRRIDGTMQVSVNGQPLITPTARTRSPETPTARSSATSGTSSAPTVRRSKAPVKPRARAAPARAVPATRRSRGRRRPSPVPAPAPSTA